MATNGKQKGESEKMRGAMGLIGTTLGTFRVDEMIGQGGMGIVYKAHDRALNRTVALKVLSPKLQDDEFIKRFIREARVAAGLDHANIVQIYSISSADLQGTKVWYIAMQYIEGKTVAEYLQGGNRLSVRKALLVGRYVADALRIAHKAGVIHRDIKPNNIMIDNGGKIKVMDFGLARSIAASARVTQTGLFLGTPEYSSPEQCESTALDGRSDIYSLGVVMYEMLSGRAPYTAETPYAIFRKIMDEPAAPLASVNPAVPAQVVRLVERMMAKNREQRYQSAEEVVRDIDLLIKTEFAPNSGAVADAPNKILAALPEVATPMPQQAKGSDGIRHRRHARLRRPAGSHFSIWTKLGVAAAILLVVGGIGYGVISHYGAEKKGGGTSQKPEQSQSMLPSKTEKINVLVFDFRNAAGSEDAGWMEAGLSDMLIADLSQCGELRVVSRRQLIDAMKAKTGKKLIPSDGERIHLGDEVKTVIDTLKPEVVVHGSYYAQENRAFRVIANVSRWENGALRDMSICQIDGKNYEDEMLSRIDELSVKIVDVLRSGVTDFGLAAAGEIKFSGGEPVERLLLARLEKEDAAGASRGRGAKEAELNKGHGGDQRAAAPSDKPGEAPGAIAKGKENEEQRGKLREDVDRKFADGAGAGRPTDPAASAARAPEPADALKEKSIAQKNDDESAAKKMENAAGEGKAQQEAENAAKASPAPIQSLRDYYRKILASESAAPTR